MKAFVSLLLVSFLVSCGASSGEVKTARDSTYAAEPATLYKETKTTLEQDYRVAASDEAALVMRTEPRWYTPDGQVDTKATSNPAGLQDKSINLVFIVSVIKADSSSYKVNIEPIVLRKNELDANPQALQLSDPTVPGWVRGKIDALQVNVYRRLKGYAVVEAPPPSPAGPMPSGPSSGGW